MTQKEKVMRYLAINLNHWVKSYELVKANTESGFTGLQADRRAFELAEVGFYKSPTKMYKVEKRRNGKYTEFRASISQEKTPEQLALDSIKYFDALPVIN